MEAPTKYEPTRFERFMIAWGYPSMALVMSAWGWTVLAVGTLFGDAVKVLAGGVIGYLAWNVFRLMRCAARVAAELQETRRRPVPSTEWIV